VQVAGESTSEIAEQYGDRRAVLARVPREWTLLHDVAWPGRPSGTIDHVAIGPTGVFVMTAGTCVAEAVAAADAVSALVPGLRREGFRAVLVGADHPAPWVEVDGVIRCESVDLARLLRSCPRVLTSEEVAGVVGVVHVGLERAERARSVAAAVEVIAVPPEVVVAGKRRRLRGRRAV